MRRRDGKRIAVPCPYQEGLVTLLVGSLFSGIGGFDLGLERAGMRVVWQCEQDEFCRRVLARHWPGVPCYPDVRALVADARSVTSGRGTGAAGDVPGPTREAQGEGLQRQRGGDPAGDRSADGSGLELRSGDAVPVPVPPVDVLCGGFPCQDISLAGKGAGIDGARSGLWGEYARLIGELRPRYVIVENVAALLSRGLGRVVGDLAALGYDAEWDCIPASAVGAPHRRDRLWLVAYPNGTGREARSGDGMGTGSRTASGQPPRSGGARDVADADSERLRADADERHEAARIAPGRDLPTLQDADECALQPWRVGGRAAQTGGPEWWTAEPPVGRVAHGVPDRLDQLAALGNALVPQIAEWLGRRIIEWEGEQVTELVA